MMFYLLSELLDFEEMKYTLVYKWIAVSDLKHILLNGFPQKIF